MYCHPIYPYHPSPTCSRQGNSAMSPSFRSFHRPQRAAQGATPRCDGVGERAGHEGLGSDSIPKWEM